VKFVFLYLRDLGVRVTALTFVSDLKNVYICIYVYMYVCIYVCMYVCMYVFEGER